MSGAPTGTLLRLAAFTTDPAGGNPAGVWIGDAFPADAEMQRIAADVGFSETAFLAPVGIEGDGDGATFRVRYYSPLAEVPFCGHATIASGVALAQRGFGSTDAGPDSARRLTLVTNGGEVPLTVTADGSGALVTTLTSVEPWVADADPGLLATVLDLLEWRADELDPRLPPAVAFAGARHMIIPVAVYSTLERMAYPFEPLKEAMLDADLTTIQLVWREDHDRFRARDPFPVGGVVEDPATGAAAAAFGAYLRDRGEIVAPASFTIRQGVELGRPSLITVSIAPGLAGIRVAGSAVQI